MKFLIQESRAKILSLIYREEDYSFDVEPLDESGDTSIMINDLQLEIDHEGRIIYAWGLCPLVKYEETNDFPQNYEEKSLVAILNKPTIPGISYRLNEKERWKIYIIKKRMGVYW